MADGYDAAILVSIALTACYPVGADHAGERESGVLSACPAPTVRQAGLTCLGCINAMEADARAADLDRVAVDDAGLACDLAEGGGR